MFANSLIIIIGAAILILTSWNYISFRQYKNRSKFDQNLNDAKYYELKSKNEFMLAAFLLVSTAITVFGYNSIQSAATSIRHDFDEKVISSNNKIDQIGKTSDSIIQIFKKDINTSIDSNNKRLELLDSKTQNVQEKIVGAEELVNSYSTETKQLFQSQHIISIQSKQLAIEIDSIQQRIKVLKSKNILKLSYYLIDSLKINYNDVDNDKDSSYATFMFKQLKTSIGDRLPEFTKPPIIVATAYTGATMLIKDVTLTSFKISVFVRSTQDPTTIFSLLIFKQDD